jgi:mycofactocin radical SAM maturase
MEYLDIQISIDGVDAPTNDALRGRGSFDTARRAMDELTDARFGPFKISVVITRTNVDQLDAFKALADSYGAQLRVTRLRPSGRGVDAWPELHPTSAQQHQIYRWLREHGDQVLTGDSFFHLNALGAPLPGLSMCGAGRVVCLIDPVGDVYACPFVIHEQFRAGSVRDAGGFTRVWRDSALFRELREPASPGACASCGSYDACQGGCMAAKFFTGLPVDGPDPECVHGHGERELQLVGAGAVPRPAPDHSRPVTFVRR